MKKKATVWWGTFQFNEDQIRFWEIGPLQFSIERKSNELRIIHHSEDDPEKNQIHVGVDKLSHFPRKDSSIKRFIYNSTFDRISLVPLLADRSQVSLAETPFFLPPNEHITVYISSPIWVRVDAGEPKLPLIEIPSLCQSDTWHGPDTQEGELCYASRTYCRTNLDELPARSNRVISPIVIHNYTKLPLLIEQMSLPLPYLSIYADVDGNLWTEEIIIKNENHHKHSIKQSKGAPHIAKNAALLTAPRYQLKTTNLITMFYSLLAE